MLCTWLHPHRDMCRLANVICLAVREVTRICGQACGPLFDHGNDDLYGSAFDCAAADNSKHRETE